MSVPCSWIPLTDSVIYAKVTRTKNWIGRSPLNPEDTMLVLVSLFLACGEKEEDTATVEDTQVEDTQVEDTASAEETGSEDTGAEDTGAEDTGSEDTAA